MKNIPIKEGLKFFAICDGSSGYVITFHPDRRVEKSTIAESILALANCQDETVQQTVRQCI